MLADGLPDWKSAVYYYRHYRKMGLMEMSILLFVILTVGQYIVSWAVYAEKKYTAVSKCIFSDHGAQFEMAKCVHNRHNVAKMPYPKQFHSKSNYSNSKFFTGVHIRLEASKTSKEKQIIGQY